MKAIEVIRGLDLGHSVAEFDQRLQDYFVESQVYKDFINGKFDIVAGEKGTGKSAIYRIIRQKYPFIEELTDIEIVPGFNEQGSPVFQRLTQGETLREGQYITVWKSFVLALIGNWTLDLCEGMSSNNLSELDQLLKALGLRSKDDSANTIFSIISNFLRKISNPSSSQVQMTVTDAGWPIISHKIDFENLEPQEVNGSRIIFSEDGLRLLNTILLENDLTIWFVLDRLDEAFSGYPDVEVPALRALLRTYLDFQEFDKIKIKLFLRNDLFRKVVRGGFVNLTHVNAKKIEIRWSEEDLFSILCTRIRDNSEFIKVISGDIVDDKQLFDKLYPEKVDLGDRRPTTWNWILSRIRDGNNVHAPRNLIDFVNKAREMQARREERSSRDFETDMVLFEPDSLKKALVALSEERVNDTLLAENGDIADYIEQFRDGKAEHNEETLRKTINCEDSQYEEFKRELLYTGFIEKIGENYKIPMLYRSGLNISQGKAYAIEPQNSTNQRDRTAD